MESEKERERGREVGAAGGRRWPTAAVGGLPSPVSPDRTFKRAKKRERSEGGRGTYRKNGASIAKLPMAGEPTPTV